MYVENKFFILSPEIEKRVEDFLASSEEALYFHDYSKTCETIDSEAIEKVGQLADIFGGNCFSFLYSLREQMPIACFFSYYRLIMLSTELDLFSPEIFQYCLFDAEMSSDIVFEELSTEWSIWWYKGYPVGAIYTTKNEDTGKNKYLLLLPNEHSHFKLLPISQEEVLNTAVAASSRFLSKAEEYLEANGLEVTHE